MKMKSLLGWTCAGVLALVFSGVNVSDAAAPTAQEAPQTISDLSSWRLVYSNDFSESVPRGSFPGKDQKMGQGYPDGTKDTGGQKGKPSRYYPSKVLSEGGGVLDFYLHTEKGTPMGAAPYPKVNGKRSESYLRYGRYSARVKSDSLRGFKTAWMLWPDSGSWPAHGEIDFPEGDLARSITGASHYLNGNGNHRFDKVTSGVKFTSWHTATVDWTPDEVTFILDGRKLGSSKHSPGYRMRYLMQVEACYPRCPRASTAGHLQVDWMKIWARD